MELSLLYIAKTRYIKKFLLFFIVCSMLFSCSKKSTHLSPVQATGYLYFQSPASDGAGLYFLTDSSQNVHPETLYFYNDSGDLFLNYDEFKDSIGLHLRLTYLDEGRRGCPFCQVIPAPQERIVKLISVAQE
jgi:hypothetical protein